MVNKDDEGKPWDIKRLILSLGGLDDEKGFISFEVFNDKHLNICEGSGSDDEHEWIYQDIDMDAARRLRDFLNYAIND